MPGSSIEELLLNLPCPSCPPAPNEYDDDAIVNTSANPHMAEAQGVRTGDITCLGMALSNALVALAGALFAQANGFADVTLGTGTIVVGLAAVIIGESVLPRPTVLMAVVGCVVGSVLYRLVVALALESLAKGVGHLQLVFDDENTHESRIARRDRANPEAAHSADRSESARNGARPPGRAPTGRRRTARW